MFYTIRTFLNGRKKKQSKGKSKDTESFKGRSVANIQSKEL
jgi:hypothetical protein